MIRVTIELVSARGAARDRLLGIAYLANEGTTGPEGRFCKYSVWLSKWAPKESQAWKEGRMALGSPLEQELMSNALQGDVAQFDNQTRGAWDLLYLALRSLIGSRNP